MNKMTIIQLLNKIVNGEEVPKKIKFYNKYYIWYDNRYTGNKGYCLEPLKSDSNSFLEINTLYDLNKEIEILEEEKKIPEKLNIQLNDNDENKVNYYRATNLECDLAFKINEIINYLDYLKSKGDE